MESSTKTCPQCGSDGPFGKLRTRSDGLQKYCKRCVNEKQQARHATPIGYAIQAWESIKKRAGNSNGKNPTYAVVALSMSRDAFLAWAVPAFSEWLAANSGRPSVNRIDDSRGYEAGNLEIIEVGENSRRRPWNKNIHAPEGTAWCSRCKAYLPITAFDRSSRGPLRVKHFCTNCRRTYMREYARAYRQRLQSTKGGT